jgi:hypothetical protein
MSTRSTIAVELADGTVHQVYCHSDGYLDHNGRMLLTHYNSQQAAEELVSHGGISFISKSIGVKHLFNNPGRWATPEYHAHEAEFGTMCKFYHRDRGEDLAIEKFWNFDMYKLSHQYEDYEYIYRQGEWFVCYNDDGYMKLTEAYNMKEVAE